jgi:hypothetical protein
MAVRNKYTAVADFSVRGNQFNIGDEVADQLVLDAVLRFGDRFVSSDTRRAKAAAADTVKVEAHPTTTPTEE